MSNCKCFKWQLILNTCRLHTIDQGHNVGRWRFDGKTANYECTIGMTRTNRLIINDVFQINSNTLKWQCHIEWIVLNYQGHSKSGCAACLREVQACSFVFFFYIREHLGLQNGTFDWFVYLYGERSSLKIHCLLRPSWFEFYLSD